jgi:hypothetical protein
MRRCDRSALIAMRERAERTRHEIRPTSRRPICLSSIGDPATAEASPRASSGRRTWWAHVEFTRINIEPIILRKKIEDLREARASMSN